MNILCTKDNVKSGSDISEISGRTSETPRFEVKETQENTRSCPKSISQSSGVIVHFRKAYANGRTNFSVQSSFQLFCPYNFQDMVGSNVAIRLAGGRFPQEGRVQVKTNHGGRSGFL